MGGFGITSAIYSSGSVMANIDLPDGGVEEIRRLHRGARPDKEAAQAEAEEAESLKHRRQQRELRAKYSTRLFYLAVGWLVALWFLVTLQGFGICGFALDEWTLRVLVGSTTVTVVGLFTVVARYLFPRDGGPPSSE